MSTVVLVIIVGVCTVLAVSAVCIWAVLHLRIGRLRREGHAELDRIRRLP